MQDDMELVRSRGGAVGAAPTGGCGGSSCWAWGSASVRQIGHVECEISHLSMHPTWNVCLQLGNSLAISPSSNALKQTAHSSAAPSLTTSSRAPSRRKTKTGREAMTSGSSPDLGGSSLGCTGVRVVRESRSEAKSAILRSQSQEVKSSTIIDVDHQKAVKKQKELKKLITHG